MTTQTATPAPAARPLLEVLEEHVAELRAVRDVATLRAACVIAIRVDRFELSQLDGKGHIVEHFTTTTTADGAAAFVIESLR